MAKLGQKEQTRDYLCGRVIGIDGRNLQLPSLEEFVEVVSTSGRSFRYSLNS